MLSNNITLEQVPQIVASLEQKVDRLVNLVLELKDAKGDTPDEWMDVEGLMAYHPDKPARKTIYDWVTLRRVPYHKTEDEMQEEAVDYVNAKRGGFRYDK